MNISYNTCIITGASVIGIYNTQVEEMSRMYEKYGKGCWNYGQWAETFWARCNVDHLHD